MSVSVNERRFQIDHNPFLLDGCIRQPEGARALVLFVFGSGLDKPGRRIEIVRPALEAAGFATMVINLVSPQEEVIPEEAALGPANIGLLAGRAVLAVDWATADGALARLPVALFGVTAAAAAAFYAASERGAQVKSLITLDGGVDAATAVLPALSTPSLFLVHSRHERLVAENEAAHARLAAPAGVKRIETIDAQLGASEAYAAAAALATRWLSERLTAL